MSDRDLNILVLTYTPIAREPRALKQIRYLRQHHRITTAGFGPAPFDDLPHIELEDAPPYRWGVIGRFIYLALLGLRIYPLLTKFSRRDAIARERLGSGDWDVIIAHDPQTMSMAMTLPARRGVVADLHEYSPRQNEHSAAWRFLIAPYMRWLCRTKVTKAAAVVTVGQGIADEYRREFGIDSTVVINATPFQELEPVPVSTPLRLVHSGVPAVQRRLEVMIDAVLQTSADVTLDFYLVDDDSPYMESLRERAAGSDRIRFNRAVPYAELVKTLNGYDVGLSIFAPTTFNLAWCLPNKFFDFIQARLGVIVGPSPEMERFVEEYGVGTVLPDFEAVSLARALEKIDVEDVARWKAASAAHAKELSSEKQSEIWGEVMRKLTVGAH
ncbi:glycosyltransferase [Microbacterium sp. NPDC090218]